MESENVVFKEFSDRLNLLYKRLGESLATDNLLGDMEDQTSVIHDLESKLESKQDDMTDLERKADKFEQENDSLKASLERIRKTLGELKTALADDGYEEGFEAVKLVNEAMEEADA
jgi:predicted RNase H-like nuclease (RuvC/YqgF family)